MPPALRILILNDEEDGLLLLRHALQKEFPGVEVAGYTDAEGALAATQQERFDGIVTDNRMPGMSGIDFVRRVRVGDKATPVVMLTGSEEKKAEALAAGVTTFI